MSKKKDKSKGMAIEIKFPEKVSGIIDKGILTLKGQKGEVKKDFLNKRISIEVNDKGVILRIKWLNKVNKKHIKSCAAHIKNMIRGCAEGHKYTLKICSGHFPMNISVSNGQLIVKNFLGEKVPRVLKLKSDAVVKVEGDIIVVEGTSKERAGQVSADIENLTRRTGYDPRIFQDGIWITTKDGKEVG